MSIGDFLFGSSDEVDPVDMRAPWQMELFEDIGGAARPGALELLQRAGEAYPGDLSAPLSTFEQGAFEGLENYLGSPLATESDLYQSARGEVESTLSGEYDPYEGEYYKAYKDNLLRELEEARDRLAAKTSAGDEYFGGGRISATGEMEESAMGDMAQMLAGLYEQERMRKLATVPQAVQMAEYENLDPLSRIETGLGLGALPRQLEQDDLMRQYAEYQRQLQGLGIPLDVAFQASTYKPEMYYPLYSHTPGLFGGPSGVSMQPGGGMDRGVMGAKTALSAAMGGAGGGGMSGMIGGAMGASPSQMASLGNIFNSLFGQTGRR